MKTLESLVRRFVEGHPQDPAKAFEELDAAEASKIMQKLSLCLDSLLLERLTPQKAGAILEKLEPGRTKEMLEAMPPKQGALIANMVIAGLSGAAIPVILKALRRDPAQSSSIFLTTVTDKEASI